MIMQNRHTKENYIADGRILTTFLLTQVSTYLTIFNDTPFRFLIYLTPLAIIFIQVVNKSLKINKAGLFFLAIYAIYCTPFLAFSDKSNFTVFAHISCSLIAASLTFTTSQKYLQIYIYIIFFSSIAMIIAIQEELGFSILTPTQATYESSFALIIPLMGIWSAANRKNIPLILSIVSSFIIFKRIALLGLIIVLILIYLDRFDRIKPVSIAARILIPIILFFIGLESNNVFQSISYYLRSYDIFISPNELSSGRFDTIGYISSDLQQRTGFIQIIFGDGVGATNTFLARHNYVNSNFTLLHNDYLRVLVDYGWFGIITLITALIYLSTKKGFIGYASIYSSVLFLTDNIISYHFYWIFLLAFARSKDNEF